MLEQKEWNRLNLPRYLIDSNRPEGVRRYYQKLCEFEFLLEKIQPPELGVQALIADYDRLDTSKATTHPDRDPEKDKALRLIQRALQLCADRLAEEPTELASQLCGKLLGFTKLPEINDLLQQVEQSQQEGQTVWLRSLERSLPHPGERLLYTLSGHGSLVNVIAVSSDGKHAVSGSEDGKLQVWDLRTREASLTEGGHKKSVTAIAITPDNNQVISGSADGTLKVWKFVRTEEIVTLREQFTLTDGKGKYAITTLAITFTSEGKWVTIVQEADTRQNLWGLLGKGHRVIKWDLEKRKKVASIDFTADTITLMSDGTKAIRSSIRRMSSQGDGSQDVYLVITDLLPTNNSPKSYGFRGSFSDSRLTIVAIAPNGKKAISIGDDKTLFVYDLETREHKFTFTGHSEEVTAVAITPDGKQAISSSKDRTLKIWGLETEQELSTLTGHTNWVNSVTITPDGKQAISSSKDGTLKVWSLENLKES